MNDTPLNTTQSETNNAVVSNISQPATTDTESPNASSTGVAKVSPLDMVKRAFSSFSFKKLTLKSLKLGGGGPASPRTKLLYFVVGIFIFLLVLLFIVSLLFGNRKRNPAPAGTPKPLPSAFATLPPNASQYADDDEVRAIQKEMEELEESLKDSNLREQNLGVPSLDWNIKF